MNYFSSKTLGTKTDLSKMFTLNANNLILKTEMSNFVPLELIYVNLLLFNEINRPLSLSIIRFVLNK
jgi:hypothetical protein